MPPVAPAATVTQPGSRGACPSAVGVRGRIDPTQRAVRPLLKKPQATDSGLAHSWNSTGPRTLDELISTLSELARKPRSRCDKAADEVTATGGSPSAPRDQRGAHGSARQRRRWPEPRRTRDRAAWPGNAGRAPRRWPGDTHSRARLPGRLNVAPDRQGARLVILSVASNSVAGSRPSAACGKLAQRRS